MKTLARLMLLSLATIFCSCSLNDPNHLETTLECHLQIQTPENFNLSSEPNMRFESVDDWGCGSSPASLDKINRKGSGIEFDEESNQFTTSILVHRKNSKFVIALKNHPSQVFEIICPPDGTYSSDWNEWHTASWFDDTPSVTMAITKQREQNQNTEYDPAESFQIRYRFEKWISPTANN